MQAIRGHVIPCEIVPKVAVAGLMLKWSNCSECIPLKVSVLHPVRRGQMIVGGKLGNAIGAQGEKGKGGG